MRQRVKRGAIFLDTYRPGWERDVDIQRLNMQSVFDCVLGQLFGDFAHALLSLPRQATNEARSLGFGGLDKEFPALTDAWRSLIDERRDQEGQDDVL